MKKNIPIKIEVPMKKKQLTSLFDDMECLGLYRLAEIGIVPALFVVPYLDIIGLPDKLSSFGKYVAYG